MGGGFALGLFPFMRVGGIVLLSLLGGIAFGLRVVLLKKNFLIPLFAINWVLVAVMAVPSLALVIWRPRIGTVRLHLVPSVPYEAEFREAVWCDIHRELPHRTRSGPFTAYNNSFERRASHTLRRQLFPHGRECDSFG